MFSLPVRIPQISLDSKILSEPMQADVLHLRGLTHVPKASPRREWDRSRTRKDLWRIVQEYFVDYVARERGPVHGCPAFDHHARDLHLGQPANDGRQVRASILFKSRDSFDADSQALELLFLLLVTRAAEHEHVVFASRGGIPHQP